MRHFLIYISCLVLFCCCSGKKPKNLIEEESFINLLAEIHMFDALGIDHSVNQFTGDIDSAIIYNSVLQKYGANKTTFNETMQWYSDNPDKLSLIYDQVFGRLNRINQNIENQTELFNGGATINVFSTTRYIDTRGDTSRYPKPFIIPIDSTGKYLLDIKIRMLEEDSSINPRIEVHWLNDSINPTDSLEVINNQINKSNYSRDYQYIIEHDNETYNYLRVTVPNYDNKIDSFKKNLQLSSLRLMVVDEAEPNTN